MIDRTANPFLMPPRTVIAFSGGRTSGRMVGGILAAHHAPPPESATIFCNTGKEREETLAFVDRVAREWGVPIVWLEYRLIAPVPPPTRDPRHGLLPADERLRRWWSWLAEMADSDEGFQHSFTVVDFVTASRHGEPFEEVIAARRFLPNPVTRFCTAEMKIRTTNRYVHQVLGWDEYHSAIGFRADEPKRVARRSRAGTSFEVQTLFGPEKVRVRKGERAPGEKPLFPLFDAGITRDDVMKFWSEQPFDLGLRQDEGNCDLCFLKGAGTIVRLLKERPESADWWTTMEQLIRGRDRPETARFRADRPSYRELSLISQGAQEGPGWLWADGGMGPAFPSESCGDIDCACTD